MYIHIYVVKLRTGPMFAFEVKIWSILLGFWKISFSLQKEENKKKKTKEPKNTIFKVKNWSNFVAQHTWTSF